MRRRFRRVIPAALAAALSLTLAGAAFAAQQPDAWVTTKVKMALLTADGVPATAVHVDTIDGRVTLHGSVPSEADKVRAERAAARIDGVTAVRNLLQVVAPKHEKATNATDAQLEKSVKQALAADPALADSSISVESVDAGVVLLAGRARTLSDAYRAVDVAVSVPGVRRIASEIQSPDVLGDDELWRNGAYDPAIYQRSAARDTWITTAAKMRLIANGETPGFDINVDSDDGIVTLFGVVASTQVKQAAESEVRGVDGVRGVVNDLQVVAPANQDLVERKDDQITKAIQTRLGSYQGLAKARIDVAVSNGVARLAGTVKSRNDQVTALTLARTTKGVVRVIDDLELEPPAVSAR